jgi:hypothetical protein
LEDLRITDPDGNVIVVPGPKVIEILNEYFENEDALSVHANESRWFS